MLQLQRCLLVCLALVYFAKAQVPGLECPPFSIDLLGSTTEFSEEGLLASSLDPGGEVPVIVPVRIMRFKTVCEASGVLRNTTSFVSVLVEFQCDFQSNHENLRDCDGSIVLTRQYQYFCNQDNVYQIRDPSFVQTLQPTADFDTPVDTSCVRCVNDRINPGSPVIDPDTHCETCPTRCLNRGLGRCYRAELTDPCCSYYNDSRCVEECPFPLVGNNVTFDCECGQLSVPAAGSISYSNEFAIGSVATYTCNAGYRREGGSTQTCTFDGWDGQNVMCALVQCPDLTVLNGTVSFNTDTPALGTEATITCDEGYALRGGDVVRTCQLDDTWSGTEPTCDLVRCPDLNIGNGNVSFSTVTPVLGTEATYTCDEGYALRGGDVVRTCQLNDTWSGTEPTCDFVQCPAPMVLNGIVSLNTVTPVLGTEAMYICNEGYALRGGDRVRTCQLNDTWTGTEPTCDLVQCPVLNVANGMITYNTVDLVLGTEAVYTCEEGYALRGGDRVRTCQLSETWNETSTWTGTEPTCVRCTLIDLDTNCIGCAFDSNGNEMCICEEGTELNAEGMCEEPVATTTDSGTPLTAIVLPSILVLMLTVVAVL